MGASFLMAFGLMLVFEGVLPFLAPRIWRDAFRKLMELTDGQLRFMGLFSMAVGLLLTVSAA
jgi:uncharacterized protein YjeT (DUF2065 family)